MAIIDNYSTNHEKKDKFIISPAHDSFFKTSWKMFIDKPILGQGPKMFRVICKNYKSKNNEVICSTHPHNFYIQILGETGFVGLIFLIGLLIYFIYVVIRLIVFQVFYKKLVLSNYQICLLAGLLITIWPLNTNGNFFNNKLMIIYGLQIGFFKKNTVNI
jgi:O-antigen ligase